MMHFHKSPLILGIIEKTLLGILKAVHWFLGLLHLRIAALLIVLGIILHFTKVFANYPVVLTVYSVLLAVSIVYALVMIVYKVTAPRSERKKGDGVEIVDDGNKNGLPDNEQVTVKEEKPQAAAVRVVEETTPVTVEETPKYYKVNGYSDLLMAEYSDKVILYRKTVNGYIKIRTDYKGTR